MPDLSAIRAATQADCAAITDCVAAAYEHYIERMGKAPGPMVQNYQSVIAQHPVYVAELDNPPAGVPAAGVPAAGAPVAGLLVLIKNTDFVLLDNVAVHPAYQGQGIGRKLMAFAEQQAVLWQYEEMQLYTHVKMTENIVLYQKLGWSSLGESTVDGYQRIYMKKALD